MSYENGLPFERISDLEYAERLESMGLTPLACEIPSLASDINARPLTVNKAETIGDYDPDTMNYAPDILLFNPRGAVLQTDGWPVGETSAK